MTQSASGISVERWDRFTRSQKILNVVSELGRARKWINEKNRDLAVSSIGRALELADLTTETSVKAGSNHFLKEWLRSRELLASFYLEPNREGAEMGSLIRSLLDLDVESHELKLEI